MTDIVTKIIELPLTVRDLTADDLPGLAWSGTPSHLGYVARLLERVPDGAVDYLVACTPSGASVAKGGIICDQRPATGVITQLAVRSELQSLGVGTLLITAAETRLRERGLRQAELDVEEGNPRARALYERLGYVAYGSAPESWDQEAPDGTIYHYETTCTLMRKALDVER